MRSSLTGPCRRSPVIARVGMPVVLTTRAAGLPSAPPARLPRVASFTRPEKSVAAAAARLVAGSAVEASLIAGAAVAQPAGTDSLPTVGALPSTADTGFAAMPEAMWPGDASPAPNDDLAIAALHGA